jgi:DNA-binding CsgD family transcriptional regulator
MSCPEYHCDLPAPGAPAWPGGCRLRKWQPEPLIGRAEELAVIRSFICEAAASGAALVLWGEAGVGKTALLDVAQETASAREILVLRAAGAEFETGSSYSLLNQLFLPLAEELGQLRSDHRDALTVALGLGSGRPSGRLVVSNATLALLRQASARQPILVLVDDLPWVDRASAAVLGFAARRLGGSDVGILAAARAGTRTYLNRDDLPGLDVQPLDSEAAARLLADRFPELSPRVHQRVLAEAQGNPLALLELAAVLSRSQHAAQRGLPAALPLGGRLQAVFAARINRLPARVRDLLLIAALDGTGDLRILQAAAGGQPYLDDLAPAESARLVYIDQGTGKLAFCHPLLRSAIVELSASSDRRRAHQALALLRTDQPERRAWHLAEAAIGPDEHVAGLLEQAARGILARGDPAAAVATLLRAAEMSPAGTDRSRRMAEAACIGADMAGDLRDVPQLLAGARQADPHLSGSLPAAVAAASLVLNRDGDVDLAHSLLVRAIETHAASHAADDGMLVEALQALLLTCFMGGRPELWDPFHRAVDRLMPAVPAILLLQSKTFADPARTAAPALGALDIAISALGDETDPASIVRTGIAAIYVDRLAGCREPLRRVVRDGRRGGAITLAIDALMLLSFHGLMAGQWDQAQQMADEGLQLCETHGYQLLAWPGRYVKALIAAARGDYATTLALATEMAAWAGPRQARSILHYSHHARSLAALTQGDYLDAYEHLTAICPAGVLASHVPAALLVGWDITEAAVRSGRRAEAEAHVTALQRASVAAISPRIAMLAAASAAMTAPDAAALSLFDHALAIPGADRFPFDYARAQLAYGERLRRARALAGARAQLAAALTTFEGLGAGPWAARAAGELRATGLAAPRAASRGVASLTPREREIARLAASGLSNKQIGQRLFLTHRTVAAHLYQVYPKLGIRSRAALHAALVPSSAGSGPADTA